MCFLASISSGSSYHSLYVGCNGLLLVPSRSQGVPSETQSPLGQELCCPCGRIIVGEYNQAVDIIQSPQKLGAFLGPARLMPRKFSKCLLVFLSDGDAGEERALHSRLHDHLWVDFLWHVSRSRKPFSLDISRGVYCTKNEQREDA
jgi:hypothetical protein